VDGFLRRLSVSSLALQCDTGKRRIRKHHNRRAFTVSNQVTATALYCFFIIDHDRRRIIHFNVTRHPTSSWIVQQLREAFPYQPAIKFLILDHDSKYGTEVPAAIRSMDITPIRTSIGCPWQNGVAERWVGSYRRELLDHVLESALCNEGNIEARLDSMFSLRGDMRCMRPQQRS
jgi:putative transposase